MSHSTANPDAPPTRRPHRVAFCVTELDPGGAERQLVRLATGIDRERFEPEVVCLSGRGELIATLQDAGVPVTCLDARGRWDFSVVERLRRHFRRTRPDLVQTFLFHANIAGRLAARAAGVPVVVSGLRVAERRRWHLRLDRLTDRLVDRHVCVSRAVSEYSASVGRLPPAKLVVIPNGIDADRFATAAPADLTEFGIPPGMPVVLFAGRLDEQKDPVRLIEAFRLVAPQCPDARLLLVGTGPLEPMLRRMSSDLRDRVIFAGYRKDVPRLLTAATCLALPSRWEGMPNVVLEAMAAGTPVVAADAEGVSELLQGGRLGTVVHDPSPAAFAEALARVLADPGRAAEIARSAQASVRQSFTAEATLEAYQRLYMELLGESRRRAGGRSVGPVSHGR